MFVSVWKEKTAGSPLCVVMLHAKHFTNSGRTKKKKKKGRSALIKKKKRRNEVMEIHRRGGRGGKRSAEGGEWTCFCNSYKHVHNASFSVDNAGGTKCLTRDASKQVKYKKKKKEH